MKIPDTGDGKAGRQKEAEKKKPVVPEPVVLEQVVLKPVIPEEQKSGEPERKKEEFPRFRENPEEDVRLGKIILAVLAVLIGGGYLLIRFFLR